MSSRPSVESTYLRALGAVVLSIVIPAAAAAQGSASPRTDTLAVAVPPASAPPTTSTPAVSAPPAATVVAGADGFGLRSPDGAFQLRVRGGVQYDSRSFVNDRDGAATDQFQVRRVRSDIQGTLNRDYDFRVNIDYAGSRVDLLDAYVNARFTPALQLRAGKMKAPVGLERLQTPFSIPFAERALPTGLLPNRDVGVQLHGTLQGGAVEYAVGAFNGVPDGGSADGDDNDSKDVAARIFVRPLAGSGSSVLSALGVGVAGTYGTQQGTPALPGVAPYRTGGREQFFRYRTDGTAAGTALLDGTRTRISPQGTWYWNNVGVLGEFAHVTHAVRRGAEVLDLTNTAWQVVGSYVLTGEETSFRGVTPARAFDPARGQWGAWEVAARVNALRVDDATFPLFADPARSARSATAYGLGVNWYVNRAVRLLVNYETTRFDAAAGGTTRPREHLVLSRLQLAF